MVLGQDVGLGPRLARTAGDRRMVEPRLGHMREKSHGRELDARRSVGLGRRVGLDLRHGRDVGGCHDSRPA